MNPEIKAKWLAALRSGKYKWHHGRLAFVTHDGEYRCCALGVLCDLAVEDGIIQREIDADSGYVFFANEDENLPAAVMKWAGLTDDDPLVGGEDSDSITYYNDILEYTFAETAHLIERYL
jgi:hypothetical protein